MRICVIAGMIDEKLHSKIAPIQHIPEVTRIDLIRRKTYTGNKITCHSPPRMLLKWLPLAELWRLLTLLYIALIKRPSIIIAFGTVPHGVYAWWIGKLCRIPVIQHVMGKNDLRLTFPQQRGKTLTLNAIKASDAVAVRGSQMAKWLISQGISSDKLFTPQNVHDFSLFKPNPEHEPSFDLIYVGLLAPYKRIDLLLEAFAISLRHLPKLKLLIVGDGPQRDLLEKQANKLGIAKSLHFSGNHPMNELPPFIQDAKAFIMTSQGEGLPMAMIEAMSCGLPAIIPQDADFSEIATSNVNALTVDSHQAKDFASAITRLFSDVELYSHLRQGALAIRKQREYEYSIVAQTELWQIWFERVIKRASKSTS